MPDPVPEPAPRLPSGPRRDAVDPHFLALVREAAGRLGARTDDRARRDARAVPGRPSTRPPDGESRRGASGGSLPA